MADKTTGELPAVPIGELPLAPDIYDDTLLPVEQQGEARHITGKQFTDYAKAATVVYADAAKESADAAAKSAEDAAKSLGQLGDAVEQAEGYAREAGESAEAASQSLADATQAKEAAETAAGNAAASETAAAESATKAETEADAASGSASDAARSATAAEASERAAKSAQETTQAAMAQALQARDAAQQSAGEAADSAEAAKSSQDEAAISQAAAKESETAAKEAQTGAETARDAAKQSETNAEEHAAAATEQAASAQQSAADSAKSAKDAETAKAGAVAAQEAAETARTEAASSATAAEGNASDAAGSAETAKQYSGKPPIIKENRWWTWDADTQDYKDTGKKAVLNYDKTYGSLAEMEADKGQPENTLAIISSSVEDEDNAKLYIMGADGEWRYLADLSGLTGVGIESWERTDGNGAAGTADTYTLTLTDGREFTYKVYNGADGEGAGDMRKDVYDTKNRNTDIFDYVDEAIAGVQPELEFDDVPTEGSQNPVTSNGIYEALKTAGSGGSIILRDETGQTNYTLIVEKGRLSLLEVSANYTPGNAPAIVDTGTGTTYTLYVDNGRLGLKEA